MRTAPGADAASVADAGPVTDAAHLQRLPADRLLTALRRHRMGGRRTRTIRRAAALVLLVIAGVLATLNPAAEPGGTAVQVAAHDIAAGATLQRADLTTSMVPAPPDGALSTDVLVPGRVAAGAIRRGEVLTDVRLVGDHGPVPGPGRSAVPIAVSDDAIVELLRPGMHVAVISVDDSQAAHIVADDAVVLSIPDAGDGSLTSSHSGRIVLLAVLTDAANALTMAALTGPIGLRFV